MQEVYLEYVPQQETSINCLIALCLGHTVLMHQGMYYAKSYGKVIHFGFVLRTFKGINIITMINILNKVVIISHRIWQIVVF